MEFFVAEKGNYGPIVIVAKNLAEAWERSVIALMEGGYLRFIQAPEYQTNTKECPMFIHVRDPLAEPRLHPKAIFQRELVEEYAKNLIFGMENRETENQHDYSYFGRLRCYPDCEVRAEWPNVVRKEEIEQVKNRISGGKCVVEVIDQVQMVIDTLKKDPTRRTCVMHTWIPKRDLDKFSPKRLKSSSPCLTQIQPQIIEGKLFFYVVMKTNDLFSAWPENAFAFTELQKWMAEQIGVDVGSYTHFAVSMQIYEDMFEAAQELVNDPVFTGR